MLIGCITGPDFETAKTQIKKANRLCNGVELRQDHLECDLAQLKELAAGRVICTDAQGKMTTEGIAISSYHNYEGTPEDLEAVLAQMPLADVYKIATFANKITDALRMLDFVKQHSNVVGMCMGPLGQITRILSPIVGSPFTFAAIGKEAAPGQLQAEELVKVYRFHELNSETKIYGLIGNPVEQSPSHKTHNAYFKKHGHNAVYVRMPLEKEEIPHFFKWAQKLAFKGVSVTMPYKEELFEYIDVVEGEAQLIGAVNTLTFEGAIYGSNTDAKGALDALECSVENRHCVILGAGGAAKAIAFEAKNRGARVSLHSRRFKNLDALAPHDILINTTPDPCPIDLGAIQKNTVVMDITLSHANSPLLNHARALGCRVVIGEKMFGLQALGQFIRWGRTPSS